MPRMNKIGSTATSVFKDDEEIQVVYHQTRVVLVRGGKVTLDSGGWRTFTTKARMNQTANQFGLRFSVGQTDRKWSVYLRNVDGEVFKMLPFVDGMTFEVDHV